MGSGGRAVAYRQVAAATTLTVADHVVGFASTAAATLPADPYVGQVHVIKSVGAAVTVTVSAAGKTIDGAATATVAPWQALKVLYTGTDWITI